MQDVLDEISQAVEELRSSLQEQYPFLLFEPKMRLTGAGLELSGQVLTEKQRQMLLAKIREFYTGPVADTLVVLEKTAPNGPRFSLRPQSGPLDVWATPDQDRLSTQVLEEDPPFSILLETGDASLIQTADGSLGWISRQDQDRYEPASEQAAFHLPPFRAQPEVLEKLRAGVWDYALSKRGAPYRLGGRSLQNGLDCSALAQLAYYQAARILLPKHSMDQMKAGLRVAPEEGQTGDLVFLRHKTKNFSHVAIYGAARDAEGAQASGQAAQVSGQAALSSGLAIHASRIAGEVVVEPLEQLLERFRLLGFRRYMEPI